MNEYNQSYLYKSENSNNQQKSNKNVNDKKRLIIAIIISIIIIICFTIFMYYLINNDTNEDNGEKRNSDSQDLVDRNSYFENDEYRLTYDSSWRKTNLSTTNGYVDALIYKDNKLALYQLGSSKLNQTISMPFTTNIGKQSLYDNLYYMWSSNGDLQDGTNGFIEISNDIYYASINFGNSKTDLLGQLYIIVSEKNNLVLTFQAYCSSNYSQYGDIATNIIKSITIKSNTTNSNLNNIDGKFVGTKEYGYVKVPNDWVQFYDVDGNSSFQYSDKTGNYIISLKAYDVKQINSYDNMSNIYAKLVQSNEITNIKTEHKYINNYDTNILSGYYSNNDKYIIIWTFDDNQGKSHYISLEGGKDINDYMDIIDTFVLSY